jgi:hypothetical protein
MLDIKQTLRDILSDKNNTTESERVGAYNELVEKSVIETDSTRTFQSTKTLNTRVNVGGALVYGSSELHLENWYPLNDETPLIDRYIKNKNKLSELIVVLQRAEKEMELQIDSYYEENGTPLNK